MSLSEIPIGPLSKIFAGNAASTAQLVQVGGNRSNGSSLKSGYGQRQVSIVNKPEQVGNAFLNFALTFVPDHAVIAGGMGVWSNLIMRLIMGNSLEGTVADDQPSTNQAFTLLLIGPDPDSTNNYIIPICYSDKEFNSNLKKDQITTSPVGFTYENRNRFVQQVLGGVTYDPGLFNKGTESDLAGILGSRSPV